MRRYQHAGTVAVALLALVGCTSLRVVSEAGGAASAALVAAGGLSAHLGRTLSANDALTLTQADGSRIDLHLTTVSATAIEGLDDASALAVSVPLGHIVKIERREFDGVKTAFLVVTVAAGVYAIARAAAQAALASNL